MSTVAQKCACWRFTFSCCECLHSEVGWCTDDGTSWLHSWAIAADSAKTKWLVIEFIASGDCCHRISQFSWWLMWNYLKNNKVSLSQRKKVVKVLRWKVCMRILLNFIAPALDIPFCHQKTNVPSQNLLKCAITRLIIPWNFSKLKNSSRLGD